MSTSKTFVFDGTFKSCSKQFQQIYTIHLDIGSTPTETNAIPVIFALLPNKTQITYNRLLTLRKKHIPNFNPDIITMNFEAAAIKAINNIFPRTQISGRNYHFNQALWRKVQNVGLVDEYKNNEEICLIIRMCSALAFISLMDIADVWLIVMNLSPIN